MDTIDHFTEDFVMGRFLLALICVAGIANGALANPHEASVPLHDGCVRVAELAEMLAHELHVPGAQWTGTVKAGEVDVSGLGGCVFVRALNASLKDGCSVSVTRDALVLHFDADRLPQEMTGVKKAMRVFTAEAAPGATADQMRTYGLLLPSRVDESKPMVVLVHGLDCDKENWRPMAELLTAQGYQVAYFTYASDGPLHDSAAWFGQNMSALHETFPTMRLNVIAHSMGGLVARGYVEGNDYAGGIDHLILLAPPNHGSKWARYRMILEVEEHYHLWRHEPKWSPTWAITDGLGEAGKDLKPQSQFLSDLNTNARRAGVKYTIVAGSQHPATRMMGEFVDASADLIPDRVTRWWAVGGAKCAVQNLANDIESHCGKSDGPVDVESTRLDGVNDWVLLPADHVSLYYASAGHDPAAWKIIRERLGH
jgi:pimeloyl-ACP methyl ester carboxylesterase